jgi:hypothetical protein
VLFVVKSTTEFEKPVHPFVVYDARLGPATADRSAVPPDQAKLLRKVFTAFERRDDRSQLADLLLS